MIWTDQMKLAQLNSYTMQIHLVRKLNPKEVLEIGVGSGFVTDILQKDYFVTTLDIDEKKKPQWVTNITFNYDLDLLPDDFFDVILMCEVLEHIPYEKVEDVLKILEKKTKQYIILSVPNRMKFLHFNMVKHGFSDKKRNLFIYIIKKIFGYLNTLMNMFSKVQYKLINKKIKFFSDGEHKWELGIHTYSIKEFRKLLQRYFVIIAEERILGNPYHHFFILRVHR